MMPPQANGDLAQLRETESPTSESAEDQTAKHSYLKLSLNRSAKLMAPKTSSH